MCIHVHVYCMYGVWNQYFCFSLCILQLITHWHIHKHTTPSHMHTLLHVYIHTLRDAVRFCFGPMLQKELDEFREDWNNHRIRKSTMAETLGGIPEFLYFALAHCGQLLQFYTHYYLYLNMCRCRRLYLSCWSGFTWVCRITLYKISWKCLRRVSDICKAGYAVLPTAGPKYLEGCTTLIQDVNWRVYQQLAGFNLML